MSPMRNQLVHYRLDTPSLRQGQKRKVDQGRQSLDLHLPTDITDRMEFCFEPVSPATVSVSLSRGAVSGKDQVPVSADTFFVSQLIRIEAQRSFGVLIAGL